MQRDPVPHGSFRTIRITEVAYNLMQGLEGASYMVERAVTADDIRNAYDLLSRMRGALTTYVSELELAAIRCGSESIEQNITVRYQ